tara:strand:+ start:14835 stop:15341 length:507 start_codon:yes stop_codon:yes gene_type:complete
MNFTDSFAKMVFELLDNAVLTWGLIACGLAQMSKLFFELVQHRKWRPAVLFETGGMPSSHSALVTGTASGIGLQLGFNDPIFALAATFAFVVMYDASGIRRAAGLTAAKVNQLVEVNSSSEARLKESLGHTRLQVLVGSLFGPFVALPGMFFLGSPVHLMQMLGFVTG